MNELLKIGAVAQLTGLSPEGIRAWERRYGVGPTHRHGTTRQYSQSDVKRLQQLKQLTDEGHGIRQLAHLSNDQLAELLAAADEIKVMLVGPRVVREERSSDDDHLVRVAGRTASVELFLEQIDDAPTVDVVVIDLPSLQGDQLESIADAWRLPIVVVYQYAAKSNVSRAEAMNITLVKKPGSWRDIATACVEAVSQHDDRARFSQRRFSDSELLHLIDTCEAMADETLHAHELAQQILGVNAYGDYLMDRSDDLGSLSVSAHVQNARSELEEALGEIVRDRELL